MLTETYFVFTGSLWVWSYLTPSIAWPPLLQFLDPPLKCSISVIYTEAVAKHNLIERVVAKRFQCSSALGIVIGQLKSHANMVQVGYITQCLSQRCDITYT